MTDDLKPGTPYRGPAGVLRDSNWLSADVLDPTRDTILEIEAIMRRDEVEFKAGGRKDVKKGYGSIKFKGRDRELGLNATSIKTLTALFGANTGGWYGKKVALFVDPNVRFGPNIVAAVRIRAKLVDAAAPTTTRQPGDDKPE